MKSKPIIFVALMSCIFGLSLLKQNPAYGVSVSYTCTWVGNGSNNNFSDELNWTGCNNSAPIPTDNDTLVFNNIGGNTTVNNDLNDLQLNQIVLSGVYGGNLTITGNSISLSDGVIDTATGNILSNNINASIELTGDQTFDISKSNDYLSVGSIALGSFNLTLYSDGSSFFNFLGAFSGNGNISVDGTGDSLYLNVPSPNFSGSTTISNGVVVEVADENLDALGSGLITIEDGGALGITSSDTNVTFNNPLIINGSGDPSEGSYGAIISCLGNQSTYGCTSAGNTSLTLGGVISVNGVSEVANAEHKVIGQLYIASFIINSCSDTSQNIIAAPNSNTSISYICNKNNVANIVPISNNSSIQTPNTGFGIRQSDILKSIIEFLTTSVCLLVAGFFTKRFLEN